MSIFELGLSFRDCQLIESYLQYQRCELRYRRAVLVHDDLYKKFHEISLKIPEGDKVTHDDNLAMLALKVSIAKQDFDQARKELERFMSPEARMTSRSPLLLLPIAIAIGFLIPRVIFG